MQSAVWAAVCKHSKALDPTHSVDLFVILAVNGYVQGNLVGMAAFLQDVRTWITPVLSIATAALESRKQLCRFIETEQRTWLGFWLGEQI